VRRKDERLRDSLSELPHARPTTIDPAIESARHTGGASTQPAASPLEGSPQIYH